MKKAFYLLLVMTIGFTACNKKSEEEQLSDSATVEQLPDLVTTTNMIRTIDFTIRGTHKDTAYTNADKIETSAGFGSVISSDTENTFYIFFNAGPHTNNTAGDFILFQIDKSKLTQDFIGVYQISPQATHPLQLIRYSYSQKDADGGTKGKITDFSFSMGLPMQGELAIDKYDPIRKIISGSYRMSAKLNYDPTSFKIGFDPDDQCVLTVSGVFANVKLK